MKRTVCILLSLVLTLTGLVGLGLTSSAVYKVGSTYTYGSYPQTEVTSTLGSALDAMGGSWTSYGYGTTSDGKKELMLYKDVTYKGEKYRGVTVNGSRGSSHVYKTYLAGNVYWFKWEPLKWRVLDPSTGFMLCESIIDSQPFQSDLSSHKDGETGITYYACDYAKSNIRTWLNQTFINTAFTSTEKDAIQTTTLDNTSALSSQYDASTTNDKVFLLSYAEATNSAYGFRSDPETTDMIKLVDGSDYAKCQGLWYCYDVYSEFEGHSCWWLRTPYSPIYACGVEYDGRAFTNEPVNYKNIGVCPAIKIGNLNAGISLQSIAVTTKPSKTTYKVGDTLSTAGMVVTATYSDGSKAVVTSKVTCSPTALTTAGTQTITVTYKEESITKTATFTVTVGTAAKTLSSIAVTKQPTKTTYNVGDTLDTTGMIVTATYSDGTKAVVTSKATCSPSALNTAGTQTITVTYKEESITKTTTFTVTVGTAAKTLSSIAVTKQPTKTTYNVGDTLDTTGMIVTATYSDGTKAVVTSKATCSPSTLYAAGPQTITVTYQENGVTRTTTFTVTVADTGSSATIAIHNYMATTTVDYRTTISFSADVTNPVPGAEIHWFVDDEDVGTGDILRVQEAEGSFTIQAKYIKDGSVIAESETETVKVKTGLLARLIAFFRGLFGRLPVITQEYLGMEIIH